MGWGFLPGRGLSLWAEGPPIWNVFLLSGLVLSVWAEASRLGWGLLFALVTSCLDGGAFQLAEKLPVWSQGFLFELRLPVWADAFL